MKKTVFLSDICEINSGGTPSRSISDYYHGDIPWAKISDIENAENGVILKTEEKISVGGLKSIRNKIFSKGTLLFAMYGSIGKVAIAGMELSTNQAILGIRPKNTDQVNIKYLKIWFERNKQKLLNQGRGVALQNLSATIIRNLEIPLPPLNDQIRIAEILTQAENLIAKRKESIKALDEFLKSTFLEMFGDPVRNEKVWEEKTAIDYAECIVPGRDKPKSFSGSMPWITTDDLKHLGFTKKSKSGIGLSDEEIKEVRARVIPKGSIIMTCVGDLGVVTIAEVDMVVNQQLHSFQCLKAVNNIFFMYVVSYQKPFMYKRATMTTVPYMNKTVCNSIPLICPPIDLQNKFAAIVEKVETMKIKYNESLVEMEKLYGCLSQRAFRGELN